MLYSIEWLKEGRCFPPAGEEPRIRRYIENEKLFDGEHFNVESIYKSCADRIARVVGNFNDVISFPVLLNYQRLMTVKIADLVCGEYPSINGSNAFENAAIVEAREYTDFDLKMYEAVIDMSRYGEAVQRIYKDINGRLTFTNWDPKEWFPIVSQDGTRTITHHCLCWRENSGAESTLQDNPVGGDWTLHVQIHGTSKEDLGFYMYRVFKLDSFGRTILAQVSSTKINTGLSICAVQQLKAFSTTSTVFGYDDYMMIDSLLSEIMVRVGQISVILDKHSDPNLTGPTSMLQTDPTTHELTLRPGNFFAVSPGEEQPKYLTWDGQLSAAFKQLDILINQLYVLSELGGALVGATEGTSGAISGTAMRFKMINPIAKARRISNSLSRAVKSMFSVVTADAEVDQQFKDDLVERKLLEEDQMILPVPKHRVSVLWYDGLPDDPKENIENAKLATGAPKMMPLEDALMEFFGKSHEEALMWVEKIREEAADNISAMPNLKGAAAEDDLNADPNKPGPQDGTGVNPNKNGSTTGLQHPGRSAGS